MTSVSISKKLVEISNVIMDNVDEINYISNENGNYIIGTKEYSEKIAQYLNQTVKTWKCSEDNLASLKKNKKRNTQIKQPNDIYLWTIPITENKLGCMSSQ